jgi:hypothetical protein
MTSRPSSPAEWAEFYADRSKERAAQAAGSQPEEHPLFHHGNPYLPKHPLHPLLVMPGHREYERAAQAAVEARRENVVREQERLNAPHPILEWGSLA